MRNKNKLSYLYDQEADILYISEGKPRKNDVTDEVDDGVIARYDYKSRKVRGLTILDFAKRGKKTTRQVKLPFNIAFGVS